MSLSESDQASQEAARQTRIQTLHSTIDDLQHDIDEQNKFVSHKVMELFTAGHLTQRELLPFCQLLATLQQQVDQAALELKQLEANQPQITPRPIEGTVYVSLPAEYQSAAGYSNPAPVVTGNSDATVYAPVPPEYQSAPQSAMPEGNKEPTVYTYAPPVGSKEPTVYNYAPAGNKEPTIYPVVPPEYQAAYDSSLSEVTAPPPPGLENIPVSTIEAIAITTFHPQQASADPNSQANPYVVQPQQTNPGVQGPMNTSQPPLASSAPVEPEHTHTVAHSNVVLPPVASETFEEAEQDGGI